MKSLINFIGCCKSGNKKDGSENLPTVVIQDEYDNKLVEKSTSKSNGSNKYNSSIELDVELNPKTSNINQANLNNINFSRISDEYEYSISLLNEMKNLGVVNNTYPDKNRSSSTQNKKQRINTMPKATKNRTNSVGFKDFPAELNLSQSNTIKEKKNVGSARNVIQDEINLNNDDYNDFFRYDTFNKLSNRESEKKKEENITVPPKNSSIHNNFNYLGNNSPHENSPNNKHLISNNDQKKINDVSFKSDRFNNANNMINIYTYTNESSSSSCSVNLNNNNIVILDSEINSNKKLILEDVAGNLFNNKKLYIDAAGLKGGLRNKRDGFTFFGTIRENGKGETVNDFVINNPKTNEKNLNENKSDIIDENSNNNYLKRSFVIFYDRLSQKYFLRNINESIIKEKSLIYIKLDKNYFIDKKKFLLMGHLLVNIDPNYTEKTITISVFFKDSDVPKKYTYSFEESPISIGRSKSATISIDHNFLSKQQCRIEYDKVFKIWKIIDGSPGGKKSTHGTWLLVDSKYELTNTTLVKIGNCIFQINFTPL